MQTNRQQVIFWFLAIFSIILFSAGCSLLLEPFDINFDDHTGISLPIGMFLVAWIYPFKIYSENGDLIGMHRQALKVSGFFIFASLGMYLDELPAIENHTIWSELLVTLGELLVAFLSYKMMLCMLSHKNLGTDASIVEEPTPM